MGDAELSPTSFLGRVGIYAVAVFYVLSGLTLFHVYFDNLVSWESIRAFLVRRVFRIFPLLWIVTLVAILLSRKIPNPLNLFLNLTGLFGFVKWDTYFSPGVWSIGNELVFYALFPIIVYCARKSKQLLALFGVVLFIPFVYFAFYGISTTSSLDSQWGIYVNPLNQAFLFFGGFVIGWLLRSRQFPQWLAWTTLIVSVAAFGLIPWAAERVDLVTGPNRILFTLICFAVCASVYKLNIAAPRVVDKPLRLMGEASYSIYLTHPIVGPLVWLAIDGLLPPAVVFAVAVGATLFTSWAVYTFFEKPFMRLGRRLTPATPAVRVPPLE